jgi:hypothetical protein
MTDTTPGNDDPDPEGRDEMPAWVLVLLVAIVAVAALLFLWTFFNISRPL